jgi:hypothetical protein
LETAWGSGVNDVALDVVLPPKPREERVDGVREIVAFLSTEL